MSKNSSYVITAGAIREQMKRSLDTILAERNVIKIPQSQQNTQEPPIDTPPIGLDGNGGNIDNNAAIDAAVSQPKFDAGVDADPDTDPKRYLQQLTGKLSTELQKFVTENQNEAQELCKYVLGMIVKQASKPLSDSDKKEIIKKLNSVSDDDNTDNATPDAEQQDAAEPTEQGMPQPDTMGESVIKETLSDMNAPLDKEDRKDKKDRTKTTILNKPYKPKF